jgi:hypothetical protein
MVDVAVTMSSRTTGPEGRLERAGSDPMRPLQDGLLRAAGRLAALSDELDELRGRALTVDERDTRDSLLREQRETRARFEHLEFRVRTLRSVGAPGRR